MVSVEDQGPGFPAENLETIFERFYTARPKGAAFGGHSGLGLSIARQIIDAHGGRIWAENVTDKAGQGRRRALHRQPAGGEAMILHAGLIAARRGGFWRGALIQGPSRLGQERPDAARDRPRRLAGRRRPGAGLGLGRQGSTAARPDTLKGLIEARGLDVLPDADRRLRRDRDLGALRAARRPRSSASTPGETETIAGVEVPLLRLRALEASAPAKLALAVRGLALQAAKRR